MGPVSRTALYRSEGFRRAVRRAAGTLKTLDPEIEGNTNLYLARLDTPWSIVRPQVRLSRPDFDWERVKYKVNEGPPCSSGTAGSS